MFLEDAEITSFMEDEDYFGNLLDNTSGYVFLSCYSRTVKLPPQNSAKSKEGRWGIKHPTD
ncbi:hypothetical protein QUF99_21175 [Bacillus sp. DX4.1]|uniref:hypothetical protein n=1 Tax=Bacillus sp. DX4.1 TaxID=3055867 RepID=UPI0025A24DB6|nr:hypothetical protein [Bacillus sp. DX4.1]MDM5189736.1 hypothetical protein [Bacillus sp. DX4.1]